MTEPHEFGLLNKNLLLCWVVQLGSNSCVLDPIPGNILKDCIEELLPIITRIVNLSLQPATVANSFNPVLT